MADAMDSRLQEIERSAGALENKLRAQVARVESGKRVTLVVGIIVILAIFIYGSWLSSYAGKLAVPEDLANIVGDKANEYAQTQVPVIAEQLKAAAPDVIKKLRDEAVSSVQPLREYAEAETLALMDRFTADLKTKVDGMVTEMLKAHKADLEPLIEAAGAPGNDVELEKAFKESLEELIGPHMDSLFADYNREMDAARRMLAYYAQPDDKLTEAERINKSMITAVLGFLNDAATQLATPSPK